MRDLEKAEWVKRNDPAALWKRPRVVDGPGPSQCFVSELSCSLCGSVPIPPSLLFSRAALRESSEGAVAPSA